MVNGNPLSVIVVLLVNTAVKSLGLKYLALTLDAPDVRKLPVESK